VSRRTRITKTNLQLIESENLAGLPAPIFVKGFLKAYAQAVQADGKEALRRYEDRVHSQEQWAREQGQPRKQRFWVLRLLISLLLLGGLIAVTLYVDLWLSGPGVAEPEASSDEKTVTAEAPPPAAAEKTTVSPENHAEVAAASSPPKPAVEVSETEPRPAPFVLELVCVAPTWIKVIIDGGTPQEMMLQPDDATTLAAEKGFSLLIGNAAGIRATLNGKPLTIQGKSGQVVTLQLP
jgi:cytoskeletal protein RodZ